MNVRYTLAIVIFHLLALLACVPALFSWSAVATCLLGVSCYGTLGLDLGYHRLLAHRSLCVPRWLERLLALVGVCCFQDGPAGWVAAHRLHHQHSDHAGDPHTPRGGFWWSHVGWLLASNPQLRALDALAHYAPDVVAERFYRRLQSAPRLLAIYIAHAALYVVAGWLWGGLSGALGLVVWGVFLRTVLVWHISWSINSLTHVWGYQTYGTGDDSRNNPLVALLSSGEGWHNNHHAEPASASNWHRWWEFDPCYLLIALLELVGLAWNVKRPRSGLWRKWALEREQQ
ncbi:MAG: fatty acid desaturase [Pirellulales bacterium]